MHTDCQCIHRYPIGVCGGFSIRTSLLSGPDQQPRSGGSALQDTWKCSDVQHSTLTQVNSSYACLYFSTYNRELDERLTCPEYCTTATTFEMKSNGVQSASSVIDLSPKFTPGYTHAEGLKEESASKASELLTRNHSLYHFRFNGGFHSRCDSIERSCIIADLGYGPPRSSSSRALGVGSLA